MTQLARGFSFVMYEHDATNPIYTIQFPFLDVAHVRVFAGEPGDAVEITTSCEWTGPTTLRVPASTPDDVPIADGMTITIRRFTPRDSMMVNFRDGAQLPAGDLNTASRQLLYIVQESIDFGTYGGGGLPGGGTGWSDTNTPTDPAIQQIIDTIQQSAVYQVLVQQIGGIDTAAETVLEEILRSNDYFDVYRKQGNDIAKAFSSIEILQDANGNTVTKIDGIFTRLDAAEAGIINVQQAVSDETSARATQINQVVADFTGKDSDTNARVDSVQQSVADEESARTLAIQQVTAAYQAADTATNAQVTTIQESYATKDYAQAVAETKVDALAGGAVAHIEERFDAMASGAADPDGAFSAVWSIRINAGKVGGKPVIGGVGLGVDPATGSTFIVQADQFAIIHPNYTAGGTLVNVQYPFVVGTVGGVTQVGINGNLVVDKTIKANHLSVNSLSAISGNLGTANGGTFRTYQLDANGAIIDPLEFRVEITNVPTDTWPLWIGSGVKNANNAVVWIDRAGNASFKGKIQANNMMGSLQRSVAVDINTDQGAAYGQDVILASFTLPAPVLLGESHVPFVSIMVNHDQAMGTEAYIEYQVGGAWFIIAETHADIVGGSGDARNYRTSEVLVGVAPATSSAMDFRVRFKHFYSGVNVITHSVRGAAIGIR